MSLADNEIEDRANIVLTKYIEAYLAGAGDRNKGGVQDSEFGSKSLDDGTPDEKKLVQYGYDEGYRIGPGATEITVESLMAQLVKLQWRYMVGARDAVLHENTNPLGELKRGEPDKLWYKAGYSYGKINESSRWWLWTLMGIGGIALVGGGYYLGTRTPAREYEDKLRERASHYKGRFDEYRRSRRSSSPKLLTA